MSKDRTYRAGVIGIGKRGLQLSRICSQLPNAEIVAAADMNPEHLERAVKALGKISCYDHHRALLDNEDLDFIIIGTWGLERRVPTVDAANAGIKGLFIEKPMATSLADCDAMIEALSQERYRPNSRPPTPMVAGLSPDSRSAQGWRHWQGNARVLLLEQRQSGLVRHPHVRFAQHRGRQ